MSCNPSKIKYNYQKTLRKVIKKQHFKQKKIRKNNILKLKTKFSENGIIHLKLTEN